MSIRGTLPSKGGVRSVPAPTCSLSDMKFSRLLSWLRFLMFETFSSICIIYIFEPASTASSISTRIQTHCYPNSLFGNVELVIFLSSIQINRPRLRALNPKSLRNTSPSMIPGKRPRSTTVCLDYKTYPRRAKGLQTVIYGKLPELSSNGPS